MRHSILLTLSAAALGLSACEQSGDAQVERALQDINVVDESNLNDVMLTDFFVRRRDTLSLCRIR